MGSEVRAVRPEIVVNAYGCGLYLSIIRDFCSMNHICLPSCNSPDFLIAEWNDDERNKYGQNWARDPKTGNMLQRYKEARRSKNNGKEPCQHYGVETSAQSYYLIISQGCGDRYVPRERKQRNLEVKHWEMYLYQYWKIDAHWSYKSVGAEVT